MSDTTSLSENTAALLVDCLLFIPRGFFYPIASFSDYLQSTFSQRNVACHHCNQGANRIAPVTQNRLDHAFNALRQALYPWFLAVIRFTVWCLSKILWGEALNQMNEFCKRLIAYKNVLENNKGALIWKYGIPLALIGVAGYVWGILIIPEIYLFFLASSWAGRVLNSCANFLVRRQHSEEWHFIKSLFNVLLGRKSTQAFYQEYRQPAAGIAKQLMLDLLIVGLLRRFSDFIYYCTEAFFGWLVLYVLVKTAAEEAPLMLDTLEGYLTELEQQPEPGIRYQMATATWLVFYHSFEQVGSEASLEFYRQLHQASHHTASRGVDAEAIQLNSVRNSLS